MSNDNLRAAITAALRRRDPNADLDVSPTCTPLGAWGSLAGGVIRGPDGAVIDVVARAGDDAKALRGVALAVGLRDDGSDPAEEVERLTRALHDAAERLGCADYDDVVAAVSDALDDAEKREREHVDEANALRMERERLTRERDEAWAALRCLAPRCAHGAIATWSVHIDVMPTKCDACRRDSSVEHEHAAALRAAGGGR